LIVTEAGGAVTGWRGEPLSTAIQTGDIAATNGSIHEELLETLAPIVRREREETQ
jgi:fructose-1,6-bisphosphatase/inositol monophosphatase family enzyme